ncbi:MAG: hypothetical protein Q7S74_02925 [Nanoarchaeota archaeon]|nr:hypothetical protein [Nanoarchaeota archaeon]
MESQSNENTKPKNWYDKSYKIILILPALLLLFSLIYLVNFQRTHDDLILKDVSLTGGTTITVFDTKADVNTVHSSLIKDFPDIRMRGISDFRTGEQRGFLIESQAHVEILKPAIEKVMGYTLTQENSSTEFASSELSQGFYQQMRVAIIFAFIFMAIVVFIIFRTLVPSFAIILCAFADIVMTLVVVDFMGMRVSNAGIIAFLMLIGYSVDTDILLTTRVLKGRSNSINERIFGAFKTGIMMTLTAVGAVAVSLIIIYTSSEVLRQIFTIVLIGLFFDIFNTWITNASLIKWYSEKKERHQ